MIQLSNNNNKHNSVCLLFLRWLRYLWGQTDLFYTHTKLTITVPCWRLLHKASALYCVVVTVYRGMKSFQLKWFLIPDKLKTFTVSISFWRSWPVLAFCSHGHRSLSPTISRSVGDLLALLLCVCSSRIKAAGSSKWHSSSFWTSLCDCKALICF